jgi:uncharacterized protein (DUF302 family)
VKSFATTVARPLADVETRVRAALQEQGFGVLTEIDVATTLHDKLGVERSPLKILGACNPHFAQRALEIDPSASLLLPRNVVLETTGDGTRVAIGDPRASWTAQPSRRTQRHPEADEHGGTALYRDTGRARNLRRREPLAMLFRAQSKIASVATLAIFARSARSSGVQGTVALAGSDTGFVVMASLIDFAIDTFLPVNCERIPSSRRLSPRPSGVGFA